MDPGQIEVAAQSNYFDVRESLSLHSSSITWNVERSLLDTMPRNGRRHGVRGYLFLTFSVFPHGIQELGFDEEGDDSKHSQASPAQYKPRGYD
ncbi:Sphingosine N-acyltransferase-like protein FUM18 [Fusarium oxysporum f. sp. albedinis]|nr:Sphingosine N-acyltransferase-like protein FUM18 [Fusarium oxysporum f. sp. albedinis]